MELFKTKYPTDIARIDAALARIDRLGVAATARGALAEGGSSDFVSRFFAPRAGVD